MVSLNGSLRRCGADCFALFLFVVSALVPLPLAAQGSLKFEVHGAATAEHRFERSDLEDMGLTTIVTDTPWTDGDVIFSGVLVRHLLAKFEVSNGTLRATALNDYSVDLPIDELLRYDVIIAIKRDDQYLTIRDRGPYWVIYPWKDEPELRTELHYSRSIWQLKRLDVLPN